MNAADILILMIFAVIPVWRLIAIRRSSKDRPGALPTAGIILSIILSLVCAGVLMVYSLFY